MTSSFIVTSVRLTPNERTLLINYTESGSDRVLPTQMDAKGFEHWLQCQWERDCPSLVEWMLHTSAAELHERLAVYMEEYMWADNVESTIRQTADA